MTQLSNCFSFSILFRHRVTNLSLQCISIVWHVPGTTPSPLVQVHHRFSRNERCCGSYQSLVASAGTWQGLEITTITYDNDFHFREVQQRFSRLSCLTVGQIQYHYWDLVTTGSKEGCLWQHNNFMVPTWSPNLLLFLHTGPGWLHWIFSVYVHLSFTTYKENQQADEFISDP